LPHGGRVGGGQDLAPSVDLDKTYFRLGLPRWHR
jgi:hypothetical protein